MTLVEAARSGKRFKRKEWGRWIQAVGKHHRGCYYYAGFGDSSIYVPLDDDLFAEDWETQ